MTQLAAKRLASTDTDYKDRALAEGDAFVARVETAIARIAETRGQSEKLGRVPDGAVAAMREAGVFRALTPMQFGGLELSPAKLFEGMMRIAAADSSAAWIGGQLNVHSFEIALMHPRMQEEFWADGPDTTASSSYAPIGQVRPVDGGFVLNGRWTFSSGVDHADWVILGGGIRNFVVPKADFTIDHGSWDVAGLRGTGSKAVVLEDVFVPDYRVHDLADTYHDRNPGWALNDRPLYRLSWLGIFNSTPTNSTVGTALAALDAFFDQSKVRYSKMGTGAAVSENPFMHLKLARAYSAVNMVRQRHLDNWSYLFDKVCAGDEITLKDKLKVRFEAAETNATCFDAITDIWPLAGACAIEHGNPMQMALRDLMAMRNHGSAGLEMAASAYMKQLFDLPAPPPAEPIDMATLAFYK